MMQLDFVWPSTCVSFSAIIERIKDNSLWRGTLFGMLLDIYARSIVSAGCTLPGTSFAGRLRLALLMNPSPVGSIRLFISILFEKQLDQEFNDPVEA